jgi:broad specificity phosphatase PhoE
MVILALVAAAGLSSAQPAQVILIRHAEKPLNPEAVHLSKAGEKRAKELVPFITSDPRLTRYGLPVALYATHTTARGRGRRTQETIAPLAKKLRLPVQTPYVSGDYEGLAKSILSNPKYRGKTVLVCWNHEQIPQLTAALGIHPEPPKWQDAVYDRVFLINYDGTQATLTDLPQNLASDGHKKA